MSRSTCISEGWVEDPPRPRIALLQPHADHRRRAPSRAFFYA